MFVLRAPYPYIATTTVMPSPAWSDSKALAATVTTMRAVDGTLYTYVTTRAGRKRFIWSFEISRHKALELREFLNSYYSQRIKATDHNDESWIGYVKNNPFEFTGAGRAGDGWPGEETMTITIEFEEQ